MGTFDSISGKAVTGKTLERLDEVEDRATGQKGQRLMINLGGQPQECFVLYDKTGKVSRVGNDVCLAALDEAVLRQSNPVTGQNNTMQLKDSSSI